MSVISIVKRQCDACKTTVEETSDRPTQDGWIHIEGTIANGKIVGPCRFDFCGTWCARDFIDELSKSIPAEAEPLAIPPPTDLPPVSDDDVPW